jgi:ATP phosphoribosyltransferase
MLVLPKNSGLRQYTDRFLAMNPSLKGCKQIMARGEDVPFWVSQLAKKGKRAIGFTGQDLFQEYCIRNGGTDVRVLEVIPWEDDSARYGKPALCFIGPKGSSLASLPRKLTVCACSKYKGIVGDYLDKLRQQGYEVEEIFVNGSVETSCSEGIADAVIDIVYSGKSMEECGLEIYEVILTSDCVVVGGKDD